MWALIINRIIYFRRLYIKRMKRSEAKEHIIKGKFPDPKRYNDIISMLVKEYLRKKSSDRELNRYILDELVVEINSSLDNYLGFIATLASLAPLMGLLGTVIGMIKTFDVISIFGTGNAKAMAGGISEALITTQAGLMVAIPGLYMSNFLKKRAQNLKQRVSSVGLYISQHL